MKLRYFFTLTMLALAGTVLAQRNTDLLDRGLVAVPGSSGGNFISWKIFGEEYYDTKYNLYRDGVKVNNEPLSVSNYTDTGGKSSSTYQVAAVVRGVEQEKCAAVKRWNAQYFDIKVAAVTDRNGSTVTSEYNINDMSLGDVDGDGITEFVIKRNFGGDILNASNKTKFHHLECYNMQGKRLWWIDCGPNMMAGPDEQWDLVLFDWDQDGRAEALMRGADNMIIHTASGSVINIGNMNYIAPRDEYTHQGAEYLLYMDGLTGEPYGWDGKDNWTPLAYPLPRFENGESDYAAVWGKADTGHRSSKHYFGAPFLDGRHPSIFLGRGCYTRHKFCALDVDPTTHELTQRWRWNEYSGGSPYFGQGFHNFQIADVDWDGRDEIMFGSMVIDDNGQGLCTTGLGHGDAQHCSDLDPYRHGQEQFTCNESSPACTYFNATTGQIYYRLQSTSDDGRALAGNFSNNFPGSLGRSTQSGLVSLVADKVVTGGPATEGTNDALYWSHLNQRVYWDGDLLDEVFDSPGSNARNGAVYKPDGGRLITFDGTNTSNSSKNNPGAIADILGDWREEVVMRSGDTAIRIFTTNIQTSYGIYTLWHDHQYRNAMVWQSVGYNQPPHKSYFLGQMEGITQAPPPLTMTGRTEIANGGTIGQEHADKHVIVCETNDTKISVADGAQPYIATFNVPSWVQGTNSKVLNGGAKINYTYYTCDVSGGAFSGSMRLVKQGDGTLSLPNVEQKYTGKTDVWAGTLCFDGSLLQSSLWLNRFAQLNSDGGRFRSIKMDYDATLRPGREKHIGAITTDSLLLGFGSRVVFDLDGTTLQADMVNTKYLSIETKNWQYGPKYLQPVFEFVNLAGSETIPGEYLIGAATELKGNLDNIRLEGLGTDLKSALKLDDDGKLYLVISTMRTAGNVVWTGSESNVWNMASTENFASGEGNADFFVSGDDVLFDDSAQKFTVSLNGELEAGTITVDNTKNYTFQGNGSLVGNTKLVKRGTGMLTIKNDNSYTGGNCISGGVVSVSSLAHANQAKGNLGGVTTQSSKFIIENGGELRTTAAVTNGSAIQFVGDEGGIINNQHDFIVDRAMIGTVLTKKGTGWMKLNVANSSLNRLVITAGTVQCVNSNTPAKTVEFQGGTLNENTGTSYAIVAAQGKNGTWNLVNDATYSNKLSGEGTLTVSCPVRSGGSGDSKWYATRTQVACDFSAFEGTLKPISNGDPTGRFTLNSTKGMPNGTMNIAADVEVQNNGKSFRIGKVTGSGKLGGSCTFSNGASVGANTWQVGNDDTWSTSVKVTSNANLTKVGSGKVTWNGANDNTGNTNINEGELAIGTATKLGTGKLTVAAGATLSGANNAKNALGNTSITINGTLSPGLAGTNSGSIFFADKAVTIGNQATVVISATRCATATNDGCTSLCGISTLTMNGTFIITATDNNTLQPGDSIRLFTAQKLSGTPHFETMGNIEWDTSRISEGLLFVKGVTAITDILNDRQPRNIYDLRGRLVKAGATNADGLRPGVYVVEGRKFSVK